MQNNIRYNKFDYAIVLMLSLLSFGNLGGAAIPLRVIAIPFFLFLILSSAVRSKKGAFADLYFFLFAFFFWMVLSLMWAIDYGEAIKEVVYFIIHAVILLGIVYAAGKAVDPIKSVCLGWMMAVVLTIPIAITELVLDRHLSISLVEADTMVNYGEGLIAQKTFASATFGNWNAYVVFLCFSLPFLIGCVYQSRKGIFKIASMVVIATVGVIIFVNASRGGTIAFLLISIFGIFNHMRLGGRGRGRGRGKWVSLISVILIAVGFFWFNYEFLTFQLLARLTSASLVGDDDRSSLFVDSINLLDASHFVGVGVGSLVASYARLGSVVLLPHNLFLELLVQYGVILFIIFVHLLFRMYFLSRRSSDPISKFIVLSALISLPVVGVVNSGYWLSPLIWCYLASIFVISFYSRREQGSIFHVIE